MFNATHEIYLNIRKIVRYINLESKQIEKDHGISMPQYLAMDFLSRQEGFSTSYKNLMQLLSLNSSTVTGILQRLEKRGFISRMANHSDKRVNNVQLTASGLHFMQSLPNVLQNRLGKRLDQISEQKREEIKNSLEILLKSVSD